MIDLRADSIIYQSQGYLVTLVTSLIADRKLGKALNKDWDKADLIISYLEAWEEKDKLDDPSDINFVLECLIILCKLNQFPYAPTITATTPPALITEKGDKGDKGDDGARGDTGLATDFQISLISVPTIVDQFLITDAKGARWDYVAIKSTGEQRSGSVIGTWTPTGTFVEFNDTSTDDIIGTTENLEFTVQFATPYIQLVAVPTAGQWEVVGSRYFIPNNGNGSGPISDVLPDGYVYIGNSSNLAQARLFSGAISTTNAGVTSINAGIILNSHINAAAAIAFSKMAVLTASLLTATDGSGVITTLATSTYPSLTEISYVKGVTSSIQTQVNNKLTDPLTTIGDIIIRNGSNVTTRLPAGSPGQVLTISGSVPSWQSPIAGFVDPMTSVGDIIRRNSGNVTSRLAIGSSGQVLTVSGGLPVWQNPASGFADPMTTVGDVMIRNASNITTRLGVGTSGQILTISGGVPIWSDNRLAVNGLTLSGNTIRLGGTLDANTTIATNGFYLHLTKPDETTYGALDFVVGVSEGFRSTTFQPGSGSLVSSLRTFGGGTSIATTSTAGAYILNFNDQILLSDARSILKGIEYGGTGYVTQLHSLTDKEYVDTAIASVVPVVGGYTIANTESATFNTLVGAGYTFGPYSYFPSIGEGTRKIVDVDVLLGSNASGNLATFTLEASVNGGGYTTLATKVIRIQSGAGNTGYFAEYSMRHVHIVGSASSISYRLIVSGTGIGRASNAGYWRIFPVN